MRDRRGHHTCPIRVRDDLGPTIKEGLRDVACDGRTGGPSPVS